MDFSDVGVRNVLLRENGTVKCPHFSISGRQVPTEQNYDKRKISCMSQFFAMHSLSSKFGLFTGYNLAKRPLAEKMAW